MSVAAGLRARPGGADLEGPGDPVEEGAADHAFALRPTRRYSSPAKT